APCEELEELHNLRAATALVMGLRLSAPPPPCPGDDLHTLVNRSRPRLSACACAILPASLCHGPCPPWRGNARPACPSRVGPCSVQGRRVSRPMLVPST